MPFGGLQGKKLSAKH
jgi:hypothetical protein